MIEELNQDDYYKIQSFLESEILNEEHKDVIAKMYRICFNNCRAQNKKLLQAINSHFD